MSKSIPFLVRQVAVLGAGVMGAQIAAHLVNANVKTLLFELPSSSSEGDPNANAIKAVDNLRRLEPTPFVSPALADAIEVANYDQHLPRLKDCDLVIEAISERMDWKAALYQKVAPHLGPHTLFVTNTSGLSINTLAQAFPESLRDRFCGVHFFNPPRYMHLVELIACEKTNPKMMDELEAFLVTTLGKGVVRAKDTPNFIANRVGIFSLLACLHHAERLGLGFDTVDALTGSLIGRPRSATFRTMDVVGLDTFSHVVKTMQDALETDPWWSFYTLPPWMQALMASGALGQKTRCGIYKKVGQDIQVWDVASRAYRVSQAVVDETIAAILKLPDPSERFKQLQVNPHPQAQFLWAIFRDMFHYCAFHLGEIANNARDVDFALSWGFGWERGPFEIWQSAGWQMISQWIGEDIGAGRTMGKAPLPSWATQPTRLGVHGALGSYSVKADALQARSSLPVYERQYFSARLLGETPVYGQTVFENEAMRCWHLKDDIAIVSFKTRLNAINPAVLDGVLEAISRAEKSFRGLVIWQPQQPFSAGADLKSSALSVDRVESFLHLFQQTTQAVKYAHIPTVAAVEGLALGGGCEFLMHCDRVVAHLESQVGLVETGVGLLPAGGGCKEWVLRAAQSASQHSVLDEEALSALIERHFELIMKAERSRSAEQARLQGYLRACDTVLLNRYELLHVAQCQVIALSESGYRPPRSPGLFRVAGRRLWEKLDLQLQNQQEAGKISAHDYRVGSSLANVLCAGDKASGSWVDESYLLDLEREHFRALLATEKTQARIQFTLKTGRMLRN